MKKNEQRADLLALRARGGAKAAHERAKSEQRADLSALREILPPWVARNWKGWSQNIPLSPRTLANMDSKKIGVKNRILIGNVVAYEKNALIEFLESRSRVIS